MKQITQKETLIIEELLSEQYALLKDAKLQKKDYETKIRCDYIDVLRKILGLSNSEGIMPKEKIEPYIKAIVGENYENCFATNLKVSDKGCVEEKIVTTIPKDKREELGITQEQLKEMIEKTPITPYNEPKVEPLIEKRFREFIDFGLGYTIGRKEMVDAKSIQFIRFFKGEETYVVEIWCGCGYITNETFTEEARATAYYNDLVEWWKYWKEQ